MVVFDETVAVYPERRKGIRVYEPVGLEKAEPAGSGYQD